MNTKESKKPFFCFVVVVVAILSVASFIQKSKDGESGIDFWKSEEEYGDIEDFSYNLSENKIILEEYEGDCEILEICSSYTVGEKEYGTDLSEFQVGIGNDEVKTVIFEDGIKTINNSIFNSCEVSSVYFPKSIELVYDNTLAYLSAEDGEKIKIHYGGTEDEWNNIFTDYERKTLKEAWNSSDKGEEKGSEAGKSAADKFNEWIGHKYDSSEFEYFFSANPDDLK